MDVIYFAIAVLNWIVTLIMGSLESQPIMLTVQCYRVCYMMDVCAKYYYVILIGQLFWSLIVTALFVGVLFGVLKGIRPLIILGMVLAVLTCISTLSNIYVDCIGDPFLKMQMWLSSSNAYHRDSKSASYGFVFVAINGFLAFLLFN